MSNRNNISDEKMKAWAKDYALVCQKHGLYLCENDDIWLQEAGEQLDLDEVEPNMVEILEMSVEDYERCNNLEP